MKLKPDWLSSLHRSRRREIDLLFSRFPAAAFPVALELGAGDGYQSTLIAPYAGRLVATEMNGEVLGRAGNPNVEYRVCDAEEIDLAFPDTRFDLVFSSNLFEHLPDPQRALRGVREVMTDTGLTIHLMPSPFWKLCNLALFLPDFATRMLEALTTPERRARLGRRLLERLGARPPAEAAPLNSPELGNNLKIERPVRGWMSRLLLPEPHGVSSSNLAEFRAFSRRRWEAEFERAGLQLIAVLKGPVMSGYGFGFDRLRTVAERLGLTSEYAYVAVKERTGNPYVRFFEAPLMGRQERSAAPPGPLPADAAL